MLRRLTSIGCNALCKSNYFVTSKRQVTRFVAINTISFHPVRNLGTDEATGKDHVKIKDPSVEMEELDLDKWKSVMRSQAIFQEQQVSDQGEVSDDDDDDGGGGENPKETGGGLKDSSSLEATRELVSMWRQAGKLVPQEMTEEEVRILAELTTKSSRKKYLKYLAIKEGHKLSRKLKQHRKRAEKEASIMEQRGSDSNAEEGDNQKELTCKNTLFLQFWDRSLDKLLNWRAAQSMLFGQPLVFDMSYESNMSRREIENTVSQLLEVEGCNRRATEPFHLHFCNLQPDGSYLQELIKRYSTETWDRLLITSTERHHVDLFPREQLVYLTADSPNVLRTFDHSKVYIIGALVDRSVQSGLSLANAKRLKLATARLPLDQFLHWDMGAKNLTLDQMMRIMLTIKDTGKWEEALKFVPKRKHGGFYQQQTQTKVTNNRARSLTNHGLKQDVDRPLRFDVRNNWSAFQSQSHHRPNKEFGSSGKDRIAGPRSVRENTPAATKTRTSFKSDMEGRKKGKQT
ncbi:tRNA methyltransferase 10 homolog C [Melanotaenia boesemani]|uniref:tRNA methyltransferase 10 homolog C n=1 Tax=Melanotaenia boesemani TaxID=1250792 RepID=UPI001C05592A|nr:tRNA methyltransferase 10 homolog C [Melanotaenia boesemani]